MDKKIKKIIACIIAIVIIIIILIGAMLVSMKSKPEKVANNNEPQIEEKNKEEVPTSLIDESKYYDITTLVRKYFNTINRQNYKDREGNSYADDKGVKESIYAILSQEYIDEEKITVENVYEHLPKLDTTISFVPTEMEVSKGTGTDKYLVKGLLMETWKVESMKDISVFVNIDYENETFSIEPIADMTNEALQIQNSGNKIEKNNYNEYKETIMEEEELFKEKFNNFKLLIVRKSEKLYNMLDEEYKNKKFGSKQAFEQYVDENYERLSTMTLRKYKKYTYNDYEQYVCIDSFGKYTIFNNKTPSDVGILLDTYTIDLPEFTEKYNKASDTKKVGYNVEKFISAINDKDYKFAYNLLDEVYRSKNMDTLEKFESYIKAHLYENNEVQHQGIEKSGNNYIYELTVSNANSEYSEEKKLTIIMQLLEGTDFVMSFSID